MANIVIAYPPDFAATATLASGSYSAGLPRDNMKTEELFKVARTTDATLTSTLVRADLTATPPAIGAVIAGPTNMSAAGLYRVMGSNSTAFSSGYTSGWLSPGVAAAEIDPERGLNVIHLLPSPQTYRYWRLEIDDTTNTAGYIDIGRLFIPRLLQPSVNYGFGDNGLTWESRTRSTETMGGVEDKGRRRNRRILTLGIDYLPEAEAFGNWYQFQRIVGFDETVFVIPDPALTGAALQGRSFWGTVNETDPVSQAAYGLAGVGLTIREQF